MRVLHLAPPSPTMHGVTAHSFIDEEIGALQEAGIECLSVSDRCQSDYTCKGVRVIAVPSPATASSIRQTLDLAIRHATLLPCSRHALRHARTLFHGLRIEHAAARAIERYGVDAIHSHFGWPEGLGGVIAAAETHAPLIAHMRGMDLLHRHDLSYGLRLAPTYDTAVRQLLTRADRTIFATEFMRRQGLEAGAPPQRTQVVRKGVDLVRFRPSRDREALQRELGYVEPMILAVGTLRPLKGYPVLLHALAQLREHKWRLTICGGGPERTALETLAATLHLRDRIHFAGTLVRNQIAQCFAAADIFVHASHIEAAGNVVLEALASGCAVVTTDCGGPREHIIDGKTGFLVPPNDPEALASRIRQLLIFPDARQKLGFEGRVDVQRRFPYGRMVDDLINVYREAVDAVRVG